MCTHIWQLPDKPVNHVLMGVCSGCGATKQMPFTFLEALDLAESKRHKRFNPLEMSEGEKESRMALAPEIYMVQRIVRSRGMSIKEDRF